MKKIFGLKNQKKGDDSDEEYPSYTDPTALHATDPPVRNTKGISQPHYPPPRPCHGSPNPQRKNEGCTVPVQTNKNPQLTANNRNSYPALVTGEPKRAPPRVNITKKPSLEPEDDYCDPIDVQRKDDYIQEMSRSKPIKDDYCEPWDSTMKTDTGNVASKKTSNSDAEDNEYLDPYDTGRENKMDKRLSRGLGRDFGVNQGKGLINEQRRSGVEVDPKHPVFEQSKPSDDYDMPWEWQQRMQMQQSKMRVPKPTAQTHPPKPNPTANTPDAQPSSKPTDDYDEPWEKKQGYFFKTQVPNPSGRNRSPVPLPRQNPPPANDNQIYEQPWEAAGQPNAQQPRAEAAFANPHERRFSQPAVPSNNGPVNAGRKFSQPVPSAPSDDYDMPWEYKNRQQFMGPPKPVRLHEIANSQEIDPNKPLDQQSWYHGPLTRQEAEELLRSALDCSFLVRNSESSRKDFSLSMKNNENFLHLKIVRQLDGQFILGQFSKPFMDIPKVINHYSKNKLNIRGAEHKYLKHPITTQPEYHTIEPEDDDGVAL